MDNRDLELLQGIQLILDPLKDDVKDLKNDMKDVKDDIKDLKGDMKNVKERLTTVEEETRRTALIMENKIEPNLQMLHDGYMPLVKKVRYMPEDIASLRERVEILEFMYKQMANTIKEKLGV